jgi:nicotinate-nucleotide pyrophosphorylase (carboxylating)
MRVSLISLPEGDSLEPEHRDIREDIFRNILHRSVVASIISEAPGVVSGIENCRFLAEKLGLTFQSAVRDGHAVGPDREVARVSGNPLQVSKAEEVLLGALSKPSGIATAAHAAKARVRSRCRVVCGGSKKMPYEIKAIVRKAVMDGGLEIRMLDQPFLYLDKNYVRMFGGVEPAMEAVAWLERPMVIQVRGELQPIEHEAISAARAGASVIMVDTGNPRDLDLVGETLRRNNLRSRVKLAFSGNIDLESMDEICSGDVDVLDIGYAILDAPCLPMRFDVIR